MSITTLSGREFNADLGGAKRAATEGPVIITDRGKPAYVLLAYKDWRAQTGAAPNQSLLDVLADPASAEIDFEPPRMKGGFSPATFD